MSAIESVPCDFCSARVSDPVQFAADPADVDIVVHLDGDAITATVPVPGIWRACAHCAELIESADRDGLLWRSQELVLSHISLLARLPPERRKQLLREHRRGLADLHAVFWRGVSEPVDDDEEASP